MAKNTGLEGFLIFGAPDIQPPEIAEVVDSLASGWLGTGPKVARFEADFAEYKGLAPTQVAAVNSCTAALHVSMIAAGIGPGDEVITTPMTFCATVNAIIHAGATPVLADVDPVTMNIDPAEVAARVTPRTRAILPVHFAGRACDMDALTAICERHQLKLIEDAAHAIETEYKDARRAPSATSDASASTSRRTSPPAKAAWSPPAMRRIYTASRPSPCTA